MTTARNSWGFTLFCDDFRQEIAGKFSLMGLYTIDMVFPVDFPITIPKLVLFVKYYELKGEFTDDLDLNIYFPWEDKDRPSITQTVKRADLVTNPHLQAQTESDAEIVNGINVPIILTPFNIMSAGDIKVRMVCGNVTTRLGRLILRKIRPDENIQFSV